MSLISVGGVGNVNVIRTGPRGGTPIVFLHCVGLDLTWWGAQIEAFCDDHDVAAFDMPSHGLSGRSLKKPSFEAMTTVVEAVIAHLGAGPVHLVGPSVGGMIAQMVALHRPDLVRSLSLVATLCTFPDVARDALRHRAEVAREEGMAKIAELSNTRWFPQAFRERRPDVLDRATTSLLAQDPNFHAGMWEMIATLDLEARLSAIVCPTLVVVGGDDPNAPLSAGEKIASLIPGASLKLFPNVGHFPSVEAPEPFNALLRHFLMEVDALSTKKK